MTSDKPDWKTRPLWALWWAVDADGRAHWHTIRPVIRDGKWVYHEGPGHHNGWSKKQFDRSVIVEDWQQSLIEYVTAKIEPPAKLNAQTSFWWDRD